MKITYLNHSGFAVETDTSILVFDYYKGKLPEMPVDKKLFFFVSHHHNDHFGKTIFDIANSRPDTEYILDNGITTAPRNINVTFVDYHREYFVNGAYIKTLRSTDCGVAYLVKTDGKTIYHAGDLHLWLWDGAPAISKRAVEISFKMELNLIKEEKIDAAFLPVDPRQENSGTLGFDFAMRSLNIKKAFPMHFWNNPDYVAHFIASDDAKEYRERIVPLLYDGDTIEI